MRKIDYRFIAVIFATAVVFYELAPTDLSAVPPMDHADAGQNL
jgi:hypothetical protein